MCLTGCGAPIEGKQADGKDCNYALADAACGPASFCDPGQADSNGTYPRIHKYGDKSHPLGVCRPKGASGATCSGSEQCSSGECVYPSENPGKLSGKCK